MDNTALKDAILALRKLSPDQIADTIRSFGLKGRPATTYGCPLAKLMTRLYGGHFVVGRKYIVRRTNNSLDKLPTPKLLATFIERFDHNTYPDLVAPPRRVVEGRKATYKRGPSVPARKRGPYLGAKEVGR